MDLEKELEGTTLERCSVKSVPLGEEGHQYQELDKIPDDHPIVHTDTIIKQLSDPNLT